MSLKRRKKNLRMPALKEGEDYELLPDGRLVFTADYHLKRGYCCGNGCRHCPYNYEQVAEPRRSRIRAQKEEDGKEQ